MDKKLTHFNLGLSLGQQEFRSFCEHLEQTKQFMKAKKIDKINERRQFQNLHEKQQLRINALRYVEGWKYAQTLSNPQIIYRFIDYYFQIGGMTLNTSAFLNTILLLGDQQQVQYWKKEILDAKAFGGYVQTQLGHGSNVQGLLTEAHYDDKTQSFRMNSPSVKSVKFWPGVLGLFSTHALIQAKTFVNGKSIGIQTFVIQIRDQNLKCLQNVSAGDIGPKLGFFKVDNGFLHLNNIKVPRRSMLMRYVQLKSNGQVIGLQNKQAIKYGYGSMLYLRVKLVYGFAVGYILGPAGQLASLYQKMGILHEQNRRRQIIQYCSMGEGIVLSNLNLHKIYRRFTEQLNAKNFKEADKLLVQCHIISSTFKALASWKGLQISRTICSKNKFSVFKTSNIPKIFSDSFPSVTYEGDNSVLLQQTAKFILMKEKQKHIDRPKNKVHDDDIVGIFNIIQYVCSGEVSRLKATFKKQFDEGITINTLWNENNQKDILQVSKLWGYMNLIKSYIEASSTLTQFKELFEKIGKIYVKSLLNETPQIYLYGFQIIPTESWKLITDQQFNALINIRRMTRDKTEFMIYSRQSKQFRARL